MNWEDLRAFLAAERAGNFAAAGRMLSLDATTIARRIGSLEASLGNPVLARTSDGLVLTPTGQGLIEHVERMEHQALLAERDARGDAVHLEGTVRLAVTTDFASRFLVHHLGSFRSHHPRIDLLLASSDQFVDLSRGEADIAIRFGRPGQGVPGTEGQGDLRVQRVGTVGISVFASKAYLERAGRPASLANLSGHDLIVATDNVSWMPGFEWTQSVLGRNRIMLCADALSTMRAACEAGFGLCALPIFTTYESKNIERLEAPGVIDSRELWLLMPGELKRVARVRAVHDFLIELFDTWEPMLSGRLPPHDVRLASK